jgi:class 3 adenylate cyclase
MKCKNCGFESPGEMRYCGQCGTLLGQVCAQCGFTNPDGYRYCGMCGAMLISGMAPSQLALPFAMQSAEQEEPKSLIEAIQPQERIRLEGERRIITAVLSDVTGSTELLERAGSEACRAYGSHLISPETEIYRYGGEVDQFRGDGLVAFFGATSAQEDDPERAILATLSMQKAVKQYAQQIKEREGIDLHLRVGVNTGEVIVASVGDRRQHSEDTAMGFAVAVASRMENAAEPDTVLVSENTYRLVRAQFEWMPLGQIMVKGVSQPIEVYRPLGPKADEEPEQLLMSELSLPLIGRETEFQTILHSVENLCNGSGGIVLLMGEEGMGKSFLVNEVRQYYARRGSIIAETGEQGFTSESTTSWMRGRCRSYNQSWPYSMWIDVLRNWLGIHPDASKLEIKDRLRAQAQALWGDESREYYPYLTAIMGLPQDEAFTEWIGSLDASGLRQRIFFAVRSMLEALANQMPLVLVFSDLHWADVSSLELLRSVLPICEQEMVLSILIFRPERQSPAWQLRQFIDTELPHRTSTVTLAPLNFAQCSQFIDQLIGKNSLPDETRELIIKNSEGNPHYILELIRSLIDDGKLVYNREKERWRLAQPVATIDLPDSLLRLLTARVDRLSAEERYVLQIASVIGPIFWLSIIEEVAEEVRSIRADLTALQKAQLIYESGRISGLGMQYTFRSELIRVQFMKAC